MNLVHPPSKVLLGYAIQQGLVTDPTLQPPAVPGTYLGYYDLMPDDWDTVVVFRDTVGRPDGRVLRTGETIEHPGIQISTRGTDTVQAWSEMNSICDAMDTVTRASVTGWELGTSVYLIQSVNRTSSIIPLQGQRNIDERKKGRVVYVANFTITLTQTT